MARKSTEAVALKSEAEAADWYATLQGREQSRREFQRALRNGSISRLTGAKISRTDPKLLAQLMEQAKANATKAI